HLQERDAGMAEERVTGLDGGDELDPDSLAAPVHLDRGRVAGDRHDSRRDRGVAAGDAVLGVEAHAPALARISPSSCSYAAPICSSSASVSFACSSSIVASAKPTCTSTQSPTRTSGQSATEISRRTPES